MPTSPTAETTPDIPPVPNPETRDRLMASERLLSSLDYTDRSSSLMPKSTTEGKINESSVVSAETGVERTSLSYTADRGSTMHRMDFTKSGGELKEITVGGFKFQPNAEGGWTGTSADKSLTTKKDKIEVTGKGENTRVTMTESGPHGDVRITIGADGARTRSVSGPNGSEHSVSWDRKGKVTEVAHNGHHFAVGADGKVTSPGAMKGATVGRDGSISGTVGKSAVTMKPDGSTVVTTGDRTTIGFGDGSRVYKDKSGATLGVRDAQGRKIMVDTDGKATVTKGDKQVAHPLSGHKLNFDSTKNPPVITKAGDKNTHYHLDGRSTKHETTKGGVTRAVEMTDAKGHTVKFEYKDPSDPTKVTGFDGRDGKYGHIEVGKDKDAKDIKVDSRTGKVTAKMNDGTTATFDLAKQTRVTTNPKDGSTTTAHVHKGFAETRSKDGKLTLKYDSGRSWDVTEGPNGKVTGVKSGDSAFRVGADGVKNIKIKDGEIRVSKDDGTVHSFKHNSGETKIPPRDGLPGRTVKTKYDDRGAVTEVTAGTTGRGGTGMKYTVERDAKTGQITSVKDGKRNEIKAPDGGPLKDFAVDGRGRISARTADGGKMTIDPERGTRTTESKGRKVVESPRGKVDYTIGTDGKATEASVYARGATEPTYKAKLGPDGKSVVELRNAKNEVVGRSRADSQITLDDMGRVKTRNLDPAGRLRSEVTINPDKSKSVAEAGKISRYTPEGRLSSVSKMGMGTARFDYHREKGAVTKVPDAVAPKGTKDLTVPNSVKFGDGVKLERMSGEDVSRQDTTGIAKFILTKDGKAVIDPGTGKPMEYKAAGGRPRRQYPRDRFQWEMA